MLEPTRPLLPDPGIAENGLHAAPPAEGVWHAEVTKTRFGWRLRFTDGLMEQTNRPFAVTGFGAARKARRHLRRQHGPKRETWYVHPD